MLGSFTILDIRLLQYDFLGSHQDTFHKGRRISLKTRPAGYLAPNHFSKRDLRGINAGTVRNLLLHSKFSEMHSGYVARIGDLTTLTSEMLIQGFFSLSRF